jgi:hypothetical protein
MPSSNARLRRPAGSLLRTDEQPARVEPVTISSIARIARAEIAAGVVRGGARQRLVRSSSRERCPGCAPAVAIREHVEREPVPRPPHAWILQIDPAATGVDANLNVGVRVSPA